MPTEIVPGLWIGNRKDSQNRGFYFHKKIKCTLNASKSLPFLFSSGVKNIRIPVSEYIKGDAGTFYSYFKVITEYIYTHLHNGENILVHCDSGKHVSPTIASAYLMRYGKIGKERAIEMVKSKKSGAFGLVCMYNVILTRFDKYLKKNRYHI